MDFLGRLLFGNSRGTDRSKDAEDVRQAFKDNFDTVKRKLEEQGSEVRALIDMIYDSSFPEKKIFMKAPSLAELKFNAELVSRILSALDSRGVPVMGMMLDMIQKHEMQSISNALIAVLELLAPLLDSKEDPKITTDDLLVEMWHPSSNNPSPLLASITISPRVGVASAGESPLYPSPLSRLALSDRSWRKFLSKSASERAASGDLESVKTAGRFSHSASHNYPAVTHEMVPGNFADRASYKLNWTPQEDEVPAKKRRRKSSSVGELLAEESNRPMAVSREEDTRGLVGLDKSNRISALELQQSERSVLRNQDGEVLDSEDFGRKPTSRAESDTRVEEPEEEARMSRSDSSNPIAAVKSELQQQLCKESVLGIQDGEAPGDEHLDAKPSEIEEPVSISESKRTGATESTGEEGAMIVEKGTADGKDDRDLAHESSEKFKTQQNPNSEAGERKRVLDGRSIPKTDNWVSKLGQRLCCGKPATKP